MIKLNPSKQKLNRQPFPKATVTPAALPARNKSIAAGVLIASSALKGVPLIRTGQLNLFRAIDFPYREFSGLFYAFPSINNFHSIRFRSIRTFFMLLAVDGNFPFLKRDSP